MPSTPKSQTNETRAATRASVRNAKTLLLPMRRADADTLILPFRLALQAVLSRRAGRNDILKVAHALLFTRMMTEKRGGALALAFLLETETKVTEAIKEAQAGDTRWSLDPVLDEALTAVVNEYDRQLREERLSEIASIMRSLAQRHDEAQQKFLGESGC